MKKPQTIRWLTTLSLGVCLTGLGLALGACSAPAPANTADLQASPLVMASNPARPSITGAELYSIHCNRCHAERYPTERTAAQWKTIMLHMQVRANIPGDQARRILQYLQENSGR